MASESRQNKEFRITVRLTKVELEAVRVKMASAGYSSVGAFIRDHVSHVQVRAKLSGDVVIIMRELMRLSAMINDGRPSADLLDRVRYIALVNAGGTV